jgi:hypothetical protein
VQGGSEYGLPRLRTRGPVFGDACGCGNPCLDALHARGAEPLSICEMQCRQAALESIFAIIDISSFTCPVSNSPSTPRGLKSVNGDSYMRHYYDVYELLQQPEVQEFIGTEEYNRHKEQRFRQGDNLNIAENEAFLLRDTKTKALYRDAYERSGALYYEDKPTFDQILSEIGKWAGRL